jgi:16S rRNA (cytosine967-C5)-methyltransferase
MAKTDKASMGLGARNAALELLGGVILEQRMLSEMIQNEPFTDLAPQERATAQRLATATLRHSSRADAVYKPYLERPPAAVIRQILRLAIVEIFSEGSATHGVVNAAVTLARQHQPRTAKMVNAVLRRISEDGQAAWDKTDPQRLPNWLRGRLSASYGNAHTARIEAAQEAGAPLDLSVKNPGDVEALATELGAEILPTGSLRLTGQKQVTKLPGFDEGAWWVQDVAAALPVKLLAPNPDMRVLDLCAAPGGKTLQLAATGANVTALDVSDYRLNRLRENLTRTKLSAEIVAADAMTWEPETPFDAVLLDAPCSATGTIRRHPDLPYVKDAAGIKPLYALQRDLIDRAVHFVKPGGQIVFCTCSLFPEEGEHQLRTALERHPDLSVDASAYANLPKGMKVKNGGIRLTPDIWAEKGGMDGFFIAVLRRS